MVQRAAYDDDFYNWTQEQAALLRDLPRAVTLPNTLDLAHIAEEIEDMGKSELRRVSSNILQMFVHLIKLSAHGLHAAPSRHWVDEIFGFRVRARSHFTPGMRQLIDIQDLWRQAQHEAANELAVYDEAMPSVVETCPVDLDDVLGDDFSLAKVLTALVPPPQN